MTMPATEHEHSFPSLGTTVRLLVRTAMPPALSRGLIARPIQRRFEEIHLALTRFEPTSELSLLNARGGEWVRVSDDLLRGVQAALYAAALSDGLVDPTLLRGIERAGYASTRIGRQAAPLAEALARAPARMPAAPHPAGSWRRIQIDTGNHAIRLPRGVRLDLGGSAKGMAVDLASGMLVAHPAFAIDAGGDVRLGGTQATPRVVDIDHPLENRPAHRLEVTTGAVATSGLRTRIWATDAGFAHHLIDPARGAPAWTGVIQATALAPSTLEAETLAKVALLRGPLAGRAALQRHGGALILDSGKLILVGDVHAVSQPSVAGRRTA
jgi:thiamine biosynthesis lipoprotein